MSRERETMHPPDYMFHPEHAGLRRYFIVHAPPGADAGPPRPLVCVLHGSGGSARLATQMGGWTRRADEAGFLAVFPEATRGRPDEPVSFLRNPPIWNDGSGRGPAGRRNVDDVGFIRHTLDDVARRWPVDPARVFATGFSNGASMCFRLGVELGDRLAAVAPVAGHLWLAQPMLRHPVSLLSIVGDADPLNPLDGGEIRTPWNRVDQMPPVRRSLETWAALLACPPKPRFVRAHAGVTCTRWGPGRDDSEVTHYEIAGAGHVWPGGRAMLREALIGKPTDKLDATDVIWTFFESRARR